MRPYMKVEEVAVELGVSFGTVYNYLSDGHLHREQIGRKKYFVRTEVMELKAKLESAGAIGIAGVEKKEACDAAA